MMYTIATLHHLRRHLGLASSDTAEDVRLMDALRAATAQIERAVGRRFLPHHEAHVHTASVFTNELLLDDDLLELTSVEDAVGVIPLQDVEPLPARGPGSVLRLKNGRYFTPGETGVIVTGVWGWHDEWTRAWRSSFDGVEDNPLSPTTNVVTVQDADGEDGLLEAPRFQVGQMIAIEDEYLRVMRVDIALNRLYVQRGVAGTANAQHPRFSIITVYQPPRDVRDLAVRWAAHLYKQGSPAPASFYEELAPMRRERV
jgi:hypothetical protein